MAPLSGPWYKPAELALSGRRGIIQKMGVVWYVFHHFSIRGLVFDFFFFYTLLSAHLSGTFLSVLSHDNESTGQAVIECKSAGLCLIAGGLPRPPTALLTSPQAAPPANQSSSSQAIRASGTAGKYGEGGMGGEKHRDIKCIEVSWEGRWSAEREDRLAQWIIAQQEAGG